MLVCMLSLNYVGMILLLACLNYLLILIKYVMHVLKANIGKALLSQKIVFQPLDLYNYCILIFLVQQGQ